MPIASRTVYALQNYLNSLAICNTSVDSGSALFLGMTGNRIQLSALTDLVGSHIVRSGVGAIYGQHQWTPAQRKWLNRLFKQFTHEVIIDRETISTIPAFSGGAKQLDKALGQKLGDELEGLNEGLCSLHT